jgi:N-dimethylarginine dimethylaminohydrolase
LGGVHILDKKLASRRVQYRIDQIEDYDFIDFDENEEIREGFALNIVTISPREILMPANNPNTRKKMETSGIVCHEVSVQEIHKMGGGLACMILPLWRG